MAEDWLADVRRFDADADENVVGAIIKYCGIALRTPNAATVTFSDATETGRVRDNFLKKKLGLADSDATLDAAIVTIGETMGGGDQNRVSVYYLLTKHFNRLETFGGTATAPAAAVAAAAASASAAATSAATPASAKTPVSSAHSPTRPTGSSGGGSPDGPSDTDDMFGLGCVAGLVALGAIILAAIIAVWAGNTLLTSDEAPETETTAAAPAPEPAAAPEPEVPEGAGVTAGERDGKPLLTVYFESGSSAVAADFETVSSEIRTYLEDNPDAKVNISGFNDPTGNAEINARLSRERAENVQAQLVALGLAEDRTDLVKPDDATTSDMTPEEARRVEITIVE